MSARVRDGIVAGLWAAVLSGAPSTLHAVATRSDPLEASLAAGSMLLPDEDRRARLLLAAAPVHMALSLGWGTAIALTAPRGREIAYGTAAGAAIAALDLGLIGRRFERIRELPLWPQVADHLAFGAVTGAALRSRDRARRRNQRRHALCPRLSGGAEAG